MLALSVILVLTRLAIWLAEAFLGLDKEALPSALSQHPDAWSE